MANRIKVEALAPAPLRGRPWTSQYDPGVPAALAYPAVPLQALLDDAAESHPDATATIFFNAKRSYRSISDAAWRFANGLRRLFTVAKERKDGHRQPFAGDPGAVAFARVQGAPAEHFDIGTRPADLAVLQYTGGTTGVSKGAMLSHRALVANTLQCRSWFTNLRDGQDTAMAVMPFFHVYGLTVVLSL